MHNKLKCTMIVYNYDSHDNKPDRIILEKIEISIHYSLPHGKQGSFVQRYAYLSIIVFCNTITTPANE